MTNPELISDSCHRHFDIVTEIKKVGSEHFIVAYLSVQGIRLNVPLIQKIQGEKPTLEDKDMIKERLKRVYDQIYALAKEFIIANSRSLLHKILGNGDIKSKGKHGNAGIYIREDHRFSLKPPKTTLLLDNLTFLQLFGYPTNTDRDGNLNDANMMKKSLGVNIEGTMIGAYKNWVERISRIIARDIIK